MKSRNTQNQNPERKYLQMLVESEYWSFFQDWLDKEIKLLRNQYDDVDVEKLKGLQGEVKSLKRILNLKTELQSDETIRKLEAEGE